MTRFDTGEVTTLYQPWTVLAVTKAAERIVPESVFVAVSDEDYGSTCRVVLREPWWRLLCWWLATRDRMWVRQMLQYSLPNGVELEILIQGKQ